MEISSAVERYKPQAEHHGDQVLLFQSSKSSLVRTVTAS